MLALSAELVGGRMPSLTARPRAIFNLIQSNLGDRYKSGFPVVKELIQNAEDAGASTIRFIAGPGWPESQNPLMRVPGLLVVNDGDFKQEDGEGMLSFGLSDKAVNAESIGRFGYGQKAVFHLCDAFVAHAFGHNVEFTEVVNPCLGVIPKSRADSWDTIGKDDTKLLEDAAQPLSRGLLLWIPLRRDDILPAPKLSFREARPVLGELVRELLHHQADLSFVLAGLRNLESIEVFEEDEGSLTLERTSSSTKILGPQKAMEVQENRFNGTIKASTGFVLNYVGRETAPEVDSLRQLIESDEWPREPVPTDDGLETRKKKAASHGAVILGVWTALDDSVRADPTIEWSVFLPVGIAQELPDAPRLSKLSLHGYFFVDSGRRYIEGFNPEDETTVGSQWNTSLRDEVVLPLVPLVLHDALKAKVLSPDDLTSLLADIRASEFGTVHLPRLTSRSGLVRAPENLLKGADTRWQLVTPDEKLRPVPLPSEGSPHWGDLNGRIFGGLDEWSKSRQITLVCGHEAALIAGGAEWSYSELEDLLTLLNPSVFLNTALASGLADFLEEALAGRRLSANGANVLLTMYRDAVGQEGRLASEEALTRVWSSLPENSVVGVPIAAGERFVLRALAAADGNYACLREPWLPPGAATESLDVSESLLLLEALQPAMEVESQADAAGAAALTIVRLATSSSNLALENQAFASLRCLRAFDGSGASRLVSLADLMDASREERLFRGIPPVSGLLKNLWRAAPGTGALYVASSAAQLLEEVGGELSISDGSKENIAALLLRASSFGSSADRALLLDQIFSPEPRARPGLRALVAGDTRAGRPEAEIIALRGTVDRLDELALRLLDGSTTEFLVEAGVASNLTQRQRSALGISEWDEEALGCLLTRNAERLLDLDVDEETITDLLNSAVQDRDVRTLPIFTDTDGLRRPPTGLWRVAPEWPVPASMSDLVPQLRPFANPSAQKRAERLVCRWTPEAQANLALAQPDAFNFSEEILEAIVHVPHIRTLELRQSKWIGDVHGRYWGPRDILDLPDGIDSALRTSIADDSLGAVAASEVVSSVREHAGFRRLVESGIVPRGRAAVNRLLEELRAVRPSAYMGSVEEEPLSALVHLARTGVIVDLPGWRLLSALLALQSPSPGIVISAFSSIRVGQVREATRYLNSLADCVQAGQNHAWTAYKSAFEALCEWPERVRHETLSSIRVQTEAGIFRLGSEVAGHGHGVAPSHQLARELRQSLPHVGVEESEAGVAKANHSMPKTRRSDRAELEKETVEGLRPVLRYAAPHVPHGLLALLIGLLGRSPDFLSLAHEELRELTTETVKKVWLQLEERVESRFIPASTPSVTARRNANFIVLRPASVNPGEVEIQTLAGTTKSVPTGDLVPLELMGNPHTSGHNYWVGELPVLRISVGIAVPETVLVDSEHVKKLCLLLAEVIIGHSRQQQASFEALNQLLDDLSRPDQATVESVQEEIRDQLPRVLRELRPARNGLLARSLEDYQATVDSHLTGRNAGSARQSAKLTLWNQVDTPSAHAELLEHVRSKLVSYGYDPNRILFELFQNADDAYVQHPLEGEARFLVKPGETGKWLYVLHWGRLINHLGLDPEDGRRKGWQRDLFNMLQLNLSEKRENETGRFGLGFKSVHLITEEVGIASRFVTCRVRGGMLPSVWEHGRLLSTDNTYKGRPATVVELVADAERLSEVSAAISAFKTAVAWLPAMSKAIRKIEIEGTGTWKAEFCPTSFDRVRVVSLSGSRDAKAIALTLASNTSLLLELDGDGPTTVSDHVPRLWQLAPLEEAVKSGWLLNSSSFRVDPGRGQLAGTEADKSQWFQATGESLGMRLIELYDWVSDDWPDAAQAMGLVDSDELSGRELFLEQLFDLFSHDLEDDLTKHLHGTSRGLGRLISDRPALPTGLHRPFARFLSSNRVLYVLQGSLANPDLLSGLGDWKAFESIGDASISEQIAGRLDQLGFDRAKRYGIAQLLKEEVGSECRIDPDLAEQIGRLVAGAQFKTLTPSEQDAIHTVLRQSYFSMEDGAWRRAALPPKAAAGSSSGELGLIISFAPTSAIAADQYVGAGLELYLLASQQSGFQRTARTFLEWAQTTTDMERQSAFLQYVAVGDQGEELGRQLQHHWVDWIPRTSDEMRESPLVAGWQASALVSLFGRLYPKENLERWARDPSSERASEVPTARRPSDFGDWLSRLLVWWKVNAHSERRAYDVRAYPGEFSWVKLRDNDAVEDRETWFTFFALGVFRTIGRTSDATHRQFIEAAQRSGWWSEMANAELPQDPQPWIDRLEDLAAPGAFQIDYPQWRRGLTDLYVVARWLPDYSDAFRNLPRLAKEHGHFLLSDALRPSASPLWQRRGLEGAPLTQSLGFGANWMIREAVRNDFWSPAEAGEMHRYAWAANHRVQNWLATFSITLSNDGPQMDLSPEIYDLVHDSLGKDAAMLGDLDLPLQLKAGDQQLLIVHT